MHFPEEIKPCLEAILLPRGAAQAGLPASTARGRWVETEIAHQIVICASNVQVLVEKLFHVEP